jgi:hypothetical protein
MWWTIEQTAEHLGMTVDQVRATRRRREWPGNVGVRMGKRLRFDRERILAGPVVPEHTDDAATAAVWLLEDIRNLVGQIHGAVADLRRWQQEQRQERAIMERADDDDDE